ncbi:MAG: glycosyltransferase [Flammeovirgaceae bacterium]|nr:glycosyltransferase [Flammeovirgaceae bacterium]
MRIRYRSKADLPVTFFRLCWLLLKERPVVVHTHLFDATLIGLTAAWITGIKRRIYTRHNSTFHHLYFPRSVKYDRWSNYLSTHIVSISQATDKVLLELENVRPNKVKKIPHGFDLNSFTLVDEEEDTGGKRKVNIPEKSPRLE